MPRIFVVFFFFSFLFSFSIEAEWIWTPDTGWINTKYERRKTPQELMKQGEELALKKRYLEAGETFAKIFEYYPSSADAEKAILLAAENYFLADEYYQAHLLYTEYLKKYPNSQEVQKVLEREYQIGINLLQGKKGAFLGMKVFSPKSKGIEILEKVIERAPYQDFSDDALLAIGNYYYEVGEYDNAKEAYKRLLKDYKDSEWKGVARYQLAMCEYQQFEGVPYDPSPLNNTKKNLQDYIKEHKDESLTEKTTQKLGEVNLKLAEKDLETAKFYIGWRNESSAKLYLRNIIKEYPESPVAKEAMFLLESLGERPQIPSKKDDETPKEEESKKEN